jgi:hypothetical protein
MDSTSDSGWNPADDPPPDEANLPLAVRTDLLTALRYSLRWTVFETWQLEGGEPA